MEYDLIMTGIASRECMECLPSFMLEPTHSPLNDMGEKLTKLSSVHNLPYLDRRIYK